MTLDSTKAAALDKMCPTAKTQTLGTELAAVETRLAAAEAEIDTLQAGEIGVIANITDATKTLTPADHGGKVITLNRAGGIAITLPAAAGTGDRYLMIAGTTFTSNWTIAVNGTPGTDIIQGSVIVHNGSVADGIRFGTAADSDTMTMNGGTQGGLIGTWMELIDIATGVWFVRGVSIGNANEATPFSAAVP